MLSGFWSTYWYNGAVFGSEIGRGFDSLRLTPTTQLSANEIAAAREAVVDRLNVQHQDRLTWQPSFAVVRSYADQLQRTPLNSDEQARLDAVGTQIDLAERQWDAQPDAARAHLLAAAAALPKAAKYDALRGALLDLAAS